MAIRGSRVSLQKGTVLTGYRSKYTVTGFLSMSSRSVTVICKDETGNSWRLKLFDGVNSIDTNLLLHVVKYPGKGTIYLYDTGEYSNVPFLVIRQSQGESLANKAVSVDVLVKYIIPWLNYVTAYYNSRNILLRDICPENVLYSQTRNMVEYCGFSNLAYLTGGATTTRTPGYGQEELFVAPETERYGFSSASDFYSMGMTILCILKGRNPSKAIGKAELARKKGKWDIPGIDVLRLKSTQYEYYTTEDKIHYLILGLTNPDPEKRWGYNEVVCWINGQHIPLEQSGPKIQYQFSKPFVINQKKCWNAKQLAEGIAKNSNAWNETTLTKVAAFAREQKLRCAQQVHNISINKSVSIKGRVFRCIYAIDQTLDGLWWEGTKFKNTTDLVNAVDSGRWSIDRLSRLLADGAISFFEQTRRQIGIAGNVNIAAIEELEKKEKSEKNSGVYRCIMLFTTDENKRFFVLGGKRYRSLIELLNDYKDNGGILKNRSNDLLNDERFRAWLWAQGKDDTAERAASESRKNPGNSFFLFLGLCESAAKSEKEKQATRAMFLRYGDFAPIVWLCNNIDRYAAISPVKKGNLTSLAKLKFNTSETIEVLSRKANAAVPYYQLFVGETLDNPFAFEKKEMANSGYSYYPRFEDSFFCCTWNNMEVCPAFLRSIGENVNSTDLDKWIKKNYDEEKSILQEKLNRIPHNDIDTGDYLSACRRNMVLAVCMTIAAVVLFVYIQGFFLLEIAIPPFIAAVMFPAVSIVWYYKRHAIAAIADKDRKTAEIRRREIQKRMDQILQKEKSLKSNIIKEKQTVNTICNDVSSDLPKDMVNPEFIILPTINRILAFISTEGFVFMGVVAIGAYLIPPTAALIFALIYGIILPYIITDGLYVNSCTAWTIVTLLLVAVMTVGCMLLGPEFLYGMIALPIVIGIIAVVLGFVEF